MNKKTFLNFLTKYHLGGTIEETIWKMEDKSLLVKFRDEDKEVMGIGLLKELDLPDSEFGVYNTSKLINGVSPLDDDMKIEFEGDPSDVASLIFSDKDVKNKRTLASVDIINNTFQGADFAEDIFDCVIDIDNSFLVKFNKVKNVDSTNIAIKVNNDKTATFIINYSDNNVDTGRFNVDIVKGEMIIKPILFKMNVIAKILNANKDMEKCKIKLCTEHGILKFEFKLTDMNYVYYTVALQ